MADTPSTLLLLTIGDAQIAIDAAGVRDVLPLLPLWRPPTLPRPLAGFVAVGDAVLPVLDPAALFGQPPRDTLGLFAHLVRPHGAGADRPCLLVDRVEDVVAVAPDQIAPVDAGQSRHGAMLAEVTLAGGAIAHLVSLDRLLAEGERARVAALAEDAERRRAEWAAA